MLLEQMTRNQKSCLLYLETCVVDQEGLCEGIRMNHEDMADIEVFKEQGLLCFGRVPMHLIKDTRTHWVELSDSGFALAHELRKHRSRQPKNEYPALVFASVPLGRLKQRSPT